MVVYTISGRRPRTFPRGEGGPAKAGSEEEWRNLNTWEQVRKGA